MDNACLILVMYVEGTSFFMMYDSVERHCFSFSASQITNQIDYRKYLVGQLIKLWLQILLHSLKTLLLIFRIQMEWNISHVRAKKCWESEKIVMKRCFGCWRTTMSAIEHDCNKLTFQHNLDNNLGSKQSKVSMKLMSVKR